MVEKKRKLPTENPEIYEEFVNGKVVVQIAPWIVQNNIARHEIRTNN